MKEEEFKRLYLGEFKYDQREEKIDKKLAEYYKDSEGKSNAEAASLYARYSIWCAANGYSREDQRLAKRRVNQLGLA